MANKNTAILNIVVELLRNTIILMTIILKERSCKKNMDMITVIDSKATNYCFVKRDDFVEYTVFIKPAFWTDC